MRNRSHRPASALLIAAATGYSEEEFRTTREALARGGVRVFVASDAVSFCRGDRGGVLKNDVALANARARNFDAVAFIGGEGIRAYRDDPRALRLAREAAEECAALGAICAAPEILAEAGALRGKNATCDAGSRARIERLGADYRDASVVVDGVVVTANGPLATREFAQTLLEKLKRST
jgi:protease I